jgi:hypothetical protein
MDEGEGIHSGGICAGEIPDDAHSGDKTRRPEIENLGSLSENTKIA